MNLNTTEITIGIYILINTIITFLIFYGNMKDNESILILILRFISMFIILFFILIPFFTLVEIFLKLKKKDEIFSRVIKVDLYNTNRFVDKIYKACKKIADVLSKLWLIK